MEIPLLRDVIIIFGLSIVVLLVCVRLGIPTLIGLLLTGVISGPFGLKLVAAVHEVELLSEIGIALLLFSIGMELSLKSFLQSLKQVIVGGSLQVGLTLVATFIFNYLIGGTWQEGVFLGCLVSLSSTAIVLKLLQERYALGTPHGEFTLSTLVFQDLIVVPMMLIVPFLGGSELDLSKELFVAVADALGILVIVVVAGTWFVPRLLFQVAKANSSRLFILTVLFICFSVSWLTAKIGLSLALGAFLSGLIISESDYNHHALGNIFPFQEIFTLFFFVSMGMLLDAQFVYDNPGLVALSVIGVTLLKVTTGALPAILLGYPLRRALLAGFALAQVGEFSFLLVREGITAGIGNAFLYQLFLATAVFSMGLTPLWVSLAGPIANLILKLPLPYRLRFGRHKELRETKKPTKDHVIIIGFGAAAQRLRAKLREEEIDYILIDNDPETVREEGSDGEPIVFGDGTHTAILNHVFAEQASAILVFMRNLNTSKRAVAAARRVNPTVPIVARTRSSEEIEDFKMLGATHVVPDDQLCATKMYSLLN